ncbi:Ig-like domain-containing protein [Neobacillus sp. 179-C4.2 HS]|uniref:Ig-like domain-containing protein n=1 Tax=Neobacillus driksii TaxID=3035913 RepID=A0ABV4Z145_9BACI|nr:Ig-like domain-containing protein [Neobacillus sp. 179.-C4.2 HS]MDP5197694.1 Ig-like domain-containing protein [Neobacillus sp. 179.-C4.2 HS]
MADSIARRYKSSKKVIWTLTISLLLISVFLFSTNAFSLDGAKRYIVFNDDKWDMESMDQPDWMTNKDSITFKVDLKEDFENIRQGEGVTEVEAPFAVKAAYQGSEITTAKVEEIKDPELGFLGEYLVTIPLQLDSPEGTLHVSVEFAEDNSWNIPASTNTFSINRDAIKPVVNVTSWFENGRFKDGEFTNKPVSMSIKVTDSNFIPGKDTISILKDGIAYEPVQAPVWKNNETFLTLDNTGFYEVTIVAADRAGNKSDPAKVNFGIVKQGPRLTIKDKNDSGFYKQVELKVESDILIYDASATIEKTINGEKTTEVKNFERKGKNAVLSLTEDGDYKVSVTVKDRQNIDPGHQLGVTSFTIDQTAPALAINGVTDQGEYSESKEAEIRVTDANVDESLTELKVTAGNQVTTYSGEEAYKKHPFTEEGVYTLELSATDKAGNSAAKSIKFIIDKSAPSLDITGVNAGEFFNSDKSKKEVTLSVEDLTLDLTQTSLKVEKDGAEYPESIQLNSVTESKAEAKHTFTAEGKYKITLTSTDKLGQAAPAKSVSFTIDNSNPKAVVTLDGTVMAEDELVVDGEKTVKITITDKHHEFYNVSVKKNGEEYKIDPLVQDGENVATEHLFKEDGVYEITVESIDKAKNKSVLTKTITIDTGEPDIHFKGVKHRAHYNSENVDVTVTVNDFTFDKNKTTLEMTRTNGSQVTEIKPGNWNIYDYLKWLYYGEMDLSFKEEGIYHLKVTAEDRFGKVNSKMIEFTIDRTTPKIDITGINEGAFVKGGEVAIGVNEYYYDTNNVTVTVQKDDSLKEETFVNKAEKSELALKFTEDGDYQITVSAEDKAGNKASGTKLSFTVDTIKPVIDIIDLKTNSTVKDQSYDAESKNVSIEVNEHNFANNMVQYEVIEKNPVTNESKSVWIGEWRNFAEISSLTYNFKDDYEYFIKVIAEDAAGNTADEKSVTFTIDTINPLLATDGIENDQNYQSTTAAFWVKDTNIDLSNTKLIVLKDGEPYSIGDIALSYITEGALSYMFKEEGNYTVTLESTDKAKRKSVHGPISFIIDSTKPVVKVEGVDDHSFNPANKNVTVSVNEKNFSTNKVELSVTKDNKPYDLGPFITNQKELSVIGHNFAEDGLYEIFVKSTDKAGNGPVTVNRTFTIDKTRPTIEITGVNQDAYYNEDKRVNVTIRDVNLDINKMTVTRDGAQYNAGGFSVSNNTASLSHNFSEEGVYNVLVEATDKAGNSFKQQVSFTMDKTKPVITPKFKGQTRVIKDGEYINEIFTPEFALDQKDDSIVSVTLNGANAGSTAPTASKEMAYHFNVVARDKAGNETALEINFTVDTTKPALSISGILDGFFNENLEPIVTYSDIHLDPSRTSVTLNGAPYKNGTKLELEKDYVFKATVTDLANNVSTRTIVFTIDKTSPVIKFKEPVSNKYFNKDIIPDLLIEDLNEYDIIALTLDGKEYKIGDPITSEGKHVLFFEVKDKAGNIKQLSVEFIIDKKAPKVIYDGIKQNEQYFETVKAAIRLDNPSDTIKSILVNGKLHNFDESADENGVAVFTSTFSEINSYEVEVTAVDDAGNKTTTVIPFEIAEKTALVKFYENKPLFAGSLIGLFGIMGIGITALVRRKKTVAVEE